MFASLDKKSGILSHWYSVVDHFHYSTEQFYNSIEVGLQARKLPGLTVSRVEYHHGGMASDKRVYLRLARERFAFDVCAAPFGRAYFFSLRFIETPRKGWWKIIAAVIAVFFIWTWLFRLLERGSTATWWVLGFVVVICAFVGWATKVSRANNGQGIGSRPGAPASVTTTDFDTAILSLPLIGPWYERVRKDTYYRYDTRLLYHTLVSELVKKEVEEVTAAKGVKYLETYEQSPILGELYKQKRFAPKAEPDVMADVAS